MLSPLMAAACTAQGEASVTAVTFVRAHGYPLLTRVKKISTVDAAFDMRGTPPRVVRRIVPQCCWPLGLLAPPRWLALLRW